MTGNPPHDHIHDQVFPRVDQKYPLRQLWSSVRIQAAVREAYTREPLQLAAPSLDHSARLLQIAQVVMSRVGAKTWQSYASHFAAFVCFCVDEGLELLRASHYAGLLWSQFLAAKGSIQVRTAQPYFSAIISGHDLLGNPKPCVGDNTLLAAFRRGWERLQRSTVPASVLVLAFSAGDAWHLYEQLAVVPVGSELALPLLFVVLSFCLLLRPDSLLSVTWTYDRPSNLVTDNLAAFTITRSAPSGPLCFSSRCTFPNHIFMVPRDRRRNQLPIDSLAMPTDTTWSKSAVASRSTPAIPASA
ncbi:hypothetical protein VOLCADRAFT_99847 [Volvox carteri f. nagariensis]|uniref:Uncharacterized protein n=1 Tax=Volvox carteri f. nagariensis TaxID=3068 RepID=D8UIT2_VOLCA|nr:uncharacterized protein VOLCADRAFT_99847 [Volvox carteri f. nagariensis]EFJ40361.1 hypothetical protein VOLCADRAFT_99847 [Volvox carteri f. nagariensis]|eukprot:XP_002958565.1 hypothetical protein VOLCADRAFT_99847 [Volvox carteri f. nagariensis]